MIQEHWGNHCGVYQDFVSQNAPHQRPPDFDRDMPILQSKLASNMVLLCVNGSQDFLTTVYYFIITRC
jgi:hypothetical protein